MSFNLFVPTWVLWALGLIAGLLLLGLAGLGVLFLIRRHGEGRRAVIA